MTMPLYSVPVNQTVDIEEALKAIVATTKVHLSKEK